MQRRTILVAVIMAVGLLVTSLAQAGDINLSAAASHEER